MLTQNLLFNQFFRSNNNNINNSNKNKWTTKNPTWPEFCFDLYKLFLFNTVSVYTWGLLRNKTPIFLLPSFKVEMNFPCQKAFSAFWDFSICEDLIYIRETLKLHSWNDLFLSVYDSQSISFKQTWSMGVGVFLCDEGFLFQLLCLNALMNFLLGNPETNQTAFWDDDLLVCSWLIGVWITWTMTEKLYFQKYNSEILT